MRELLAIDRRQSLEGTGTAEIRVAVPHAFTPPRALLDLGLSAAEVGDLIQVLLETVRTAGAGTVADGVDIRDEVFSPRNADIGLRKESTDAGVLAWVPGSGLNRRLDYLTKLFAVRQIAADPRNCLAGIWTYLTKAESGWQKVLVPYADRRRGALWKLSHERLEFRIAGANGPDARAYYPYVQQCPGGWLTVVPSPQ